MLIQAKCQHTCRWSIWHHLDFVFHGRVDNCGQAYLDRFDQVGGGVGHFFGWLDKLPLGHRVGSLGGGQSAGVAQRRRVLGHDGGGRKHLNAEGTRRDDSWRISSMSSHTKYFGKDSRNNARNVQQKKITCTENTIYDLERGPLVVLRKRWQWGSLCTWDCVQDGSTRFWQAIWIDWLALANWEGSTRPFWPAELLGSETPTKYAAWRQKNNNKWVTKLLLSSFFCNY